MTSKKPWSGRFKKDLDQDVEKYLSFEDLKLDERLMQYDIIGTEAHDIMLYSIQVLKKSDLKAILTVLEELKAKIEQDDFSLDLQFEDVHMNIEHYVIDQVGPEIGGMVHLARSRNDQVLVDLRLYMRDQLLTLIGIILGTCESLLAKAGKTQELIMPGYTHLQHAQPMTFGFWCLASVDFLLRAVDRLNEVYARVNQNPLGAGAIAGVAWPIDREMTMKLLGFNGIQENALDVVSSRGEIAAEIVFILTLIMNHLSKVATDLILWSSYEFGMITLDDSYATGSSIMPQKKNPDVCELLRAKASRVGGFLYQILNISKGIPLSYNRDLQETKGPLMSGFEATKDSIKLFKGIIETLILNPTRMQELAKANFTTATDLIDLLMKKAGISFRSAHELVGKIVQNSMEEEMSPQDLTSKFIQKILEKEGIKGIVLDDEELTKVLDPLEAVKKKTHLGGTAPQEVKRMVQKRKKKILDYKETNKIKEEKIIFSLNELQKQIQEYLK